MRRLWKAVAEADDGACAVDRSQRVGFWNDAAERILGYHEREVVGRACYEVFLGKPRPGCLECGVDCLVMLAVRQYQIIPSYNLLSQTKEGTSVLLNVSVILLPPSETPLATLLLFRDVTQQMQYETYIEQILHAARRLPPPQTTLRRELPEARVYPAPLTPREKEVLYFLIRGNTPRDIATTLELSYATVRNYLQNILSKFGVHSQREVVKLAIERHLV
jgi:PAS domain S-box-containing protein